MERSPLRSLLFVPGDSERKLSKAESCAADALILDLEDSVAPNRASAARDLVLSYLKAHSDRSKCRLFVRINDQQPCRSARSHDSRGRARWNHVAQDKFW
jgi:citrate lyase beta subunit